ncbi:hypothetical protein BS639_02640 [Rouxiella silvae]|uniref:Conjugal transfer protein n=1 Tax=Rouxiella silvae TaxID=1646373 RepID=A0AA41BYX3_9GAMM|nr:hypothetical protein [Rouxiella silvae]MBF6639616.1 hypothetical protein [Rouxiella silvae]ORJ22738.1 hypothetical protein BS639_02640 [Rouxiella silvae]
MKLPRYLQIALLATCALALYSLLGDEADEPVPLSVVHRAPSPSAVKITPTATSQLEQSFVDLFPSGIKPLKPAPELEAVHKAPVVAKVEEPLVPSLPFNLVGSWWSDGQRALMLQQGSQHWIICKKCRAPQRVWIGMPLNKDWQLKSVSTDSLTFLWLPQMREQRLPLGDMKSEPTFKDAKHKNAK